MLYMVFSFTAIRKDRIIGGENLRLLKRTIAGNGNDCSNENKSVKTGVSS